MTIRLPVRRASVALVVTAALALSACGSEEGSDPVLDADRDTAVATDEPATTGDASTDASTAATTTPDVDAPEKPEVELPDEIPTELQVTELIPGEGEPAAAGDTVEVRYVGVLSDDGTEFDNSYDRGSTYPVTVGVGEVIEGWDRGLIDVQAGGRYQLDIPADLAYGDTGAGDVIGPGDAITFVVDVVSVTPREVPEPPEQADPSECPAPDSSEEQQRDFDDEPPFCIDVTASYTAEIVTNMGDLTVELYADRAPRTVNNFVVLARYHYFDGTECHRAIPGFMVQCGDPTATGTGGPGYTIPDELPLPGEYQIGSLAMANTGQPDSGGSQFFMITGEQARMLPPQYSLFGQITDGLDTTLVALDEAGNPADNGVPPLETITIESVTISES